MRLKDIRHIYFLGIGGIGMSALARYFNSIGKKVYGYDLRKSSLTIQLEAEGMLITYKDSIDELSSEELDLIVYTPAIPESNALYQYFINKGTLMMKRAEVLGVISKDTFTIGVAGTHGKTSITTMIAHLLKSAGLGCSAFLGGVSTNYGTNYIEGNSRIVVIEADEYDRSFLQLSPTIAVVSSLDADHLDIYGDLSTMVSSFQEYIYRVSKDGTVFLNGSIKDELYVDSEVLVYSAFEYSDSCLKALYIDEESKPPKVRIDCKLLGAQFQGLPLHAPGMYNVENTLVACSVAKLLGVSDEAIRKGMETFKGTKRRFEYHLDGTITNEVYIDDYAHHPTEIKSALEAVRQIYSKNKITVAFQPHLYSRTNDFCEAFGKSLSIADEVILLDIYPAREQPIEGVTSKLIFDHIDLEAKELCTKENLLSVIAQKKIEVLVTMGAGDIDRSIVGIKELLLK